VLVSSTDDILDGTGVVRFDYEADDDTSSVAETEGGTRLQLAANVLVVVGEVVLYLTRQMLVVHDVWEEAAAMGEMFVTRSRPRFSVPLHKVTSAELRQGRIYGRPQSDVLLEVVLDDLAASQDAEVDADEEGTPVCLLLHSEDVEKLVVWRDAIVGCM